MCFTRSPYPLPQTTLRLPNSTPASWKDREHQDAAALVERSRGPDALRDSYRRLLAVVAARPPTRTVVTVDGEVDQAYADLLTRLSS